MAADAEAFRQKVIDAGIRGKLTEQLPEDGTAQELFERIQKEKECLVKEGKIKKQKPLSPIKPEEIPFEIPENWMWVRFENISYIVRGGSPRPIKRYITNDPDGINWIKIGDVEKGGKYIYSAKEKIIPEGEKRSRHVYPGDFLLTNSMSFGRPYISRIEGCIHDGWLLVRNLGGFNVDYLYYLLSSGFLYDQFIEKASGSTVDNLNIEKVNSSLIPFPPLAEQQRIAKRIEEILSVQQDLQNLLESYTSDVSALKFKVIDAGIQGRLTEQLPEDGTAQELFEQIQEEKTRLVKKGKIKKLECYAKTGQGWDKNLDSLCSILESELKTLDATFRFHTGGSLMKYTKKERMNIGRQIYEDQINKYEAAGKYGISAQTAREYMRMYRNTNHLPPKTSKPRDYGLAKAKVIPEAAKLDEYQKMSKEDLISALIDARIREERLKLGYEVVEEDDSKKKLITYVKKTAK